jgi:putative ABC transport system permease protein
MLTLAMRSLRRRTSAFAATFIVVFLGAVLVMAFASLADTGAAGTVSDTDREKLTTMASVVGGWGLILVAFAFGPVAPLTGLGVTVLAALAAAVLTSRRVAKMRVVEALSSAAEAKESGTRLGKIRIVVGVVFLGLGVELSVMGALAGPEGLDAMQFAGSADILFGIAMTFFAPTLMRWATALLAGPVQRFGGPSGYLAVLNLRRRTGRLAAVLTPVILFVGIAVGTLWMQVIQNEANVAAGMKTADDDAVRTLNYVVIGAIVLFACIMLINTLIAATTYRRREFGQQRLAGATSRQVLGMILLEGAVLIVAGLLFGTIAAMTTVVPMTYAKTGSWLPDPQPGLWLGVAAVAVTVILATLLATARRTLRIPAIDAVAGAS